MSTHEYTIRRKVFTLFGAKFHIYREDGSLIGFCKQKAFKLREDMRIYTNESMSDERMRIAARGIIDFGMTHDVYDSKGEQYLGALKRSGFKSMLRDQWLVFDVDGQEVGSIQEDSFAMAMLRRALPLPIPQTFHLTSGAETLAEFRTHFNPFVHRLTVTVPDVCPVNPLLVLAGGILLVAIEGRHRN